jgi:hypothetical protein
LHFEVFEEKRKEFEGREPSGLCLPEAETLVVFLFALVEFLI